MISRRKEEYQNYLALTLHDPMTNTKNYCSLLKHFYNGKKVPIIPPLLIDNRIISDSEKKANHFNNFFASHGTTLNNTSKISENQTYTTNTKLSFIKFENKDIINVKESLNVDKVHGHVNIFIRMLQICDTIIVEPLSDMQQLYNPKYVC